MTELERQINLSLRALDRAYFVSRISREEYRERRRRLLASLINDSQVVTARISINKSGAASVQTLQNRRLGPTSESESAHGSRTFQKSFLSAKYITIIIGTVFFCGALLYWWLTRG